MTTVNITIAVQHEQIKSIHIFDRLVKNIFLGVWQNFNNYGMYAMR